MLPFSPLFSQKKGVKIGSIEIVGNRHTARNTMLRDLDIEVGDSIAPHEFARTMARNRLFLMNLGLFSDVSMEIGMPSDTSDFVPVKVNVRERTRSSFIPIFELADRNFNVWRRDHDLSPRYLDYGGWLLLKNFLGRNDRVRLKMNWGYSRHYEVKYELPGLGLDRVFGLEGQFLWQRKREIGYRTLDNRLQLFFNPDLFSFDRRLVALTIKARPMLFWSYGGRISYNQHRVRENISNELNPDFFIGKKDQQRYFEFSTNVRHDLRDAKPYPLHGHFEEFEIRRAGSKNGDLNLMTASLQTAFWRSFSPLFSTEFDLKSRIVLTADKIPYFNYPGLGYGRDFLHGYEYYVIDGAQYGRLKTAMRLKIHDRTWDFSPFVPFQGLKTWPLRAYFTLNNDLGYVRDQFYAAENPLANQLLWGGGIGLDVVAKFSIVGQVELSVNQRGEWGVFISAKTPL